MIDVLVAGAGPAGSIAALLLARAGARVLIVDRETFPRDKLCGDTLNPGGLALLREIGLDPEAGGPLAHAPRLSGMFVTGPSAHVLARYGAGQHGCAISRRTFDAWLLDRAIEAGARFECGWHVVAALSTPASDGASVVRGVIVRRRGASDTLRLPAAITIAAEGRRSPTAMSMGLIRHPARPRRWAIGAYASDIADVGDYGEMHIRGTHYVGVAPVGGGLANVCVVVERQGLIGRPPMQVLQEAIAADVRLGPRFLQARYEGSVRVLGPLAVDAAGAGVPGLLLAGDAAGFIDPMTGDGLSLAMRGAVLAAEEALRALAIGDLSGAAARLAAARRRMLGRKLRFNRILRHISGSERSVRLAGRVGRMWPGVLGRLVSVAGDAA